MTLPLYDQALRDFKAAFAKADDCTGCRETLDHELVCACLDEDALREIRERNREATPLLHLVSTHDGVEL